MCLAQAIEIFHNVSTPFGTLATCHLLIKILRRSSQKNPSVEEAGLISRGVAMCSDFGPFEGSISETMQDTTTTTTTTTTQSKQQGQ